MAGRGLGVLLLLALMLAGCARGSDSTPLAFVGRDGQIYTVAVNSGAPRRVSEISLPPPKDARDISYQWPTWSADGQQLAYLRFHRDSSGTIGSAVIVSRADGSGARVVFETGPGRVSVTPFYLDWAPDGETLALGAQRGPTVNVLLLDATGSREARVVTAASPVFYAWSPDSKALLVHPFGDARFNPQAEVALFHVEREWDDRFVLPARPVGFRAPVWSPDGKRAVVASSGDNQRAQVLVFDTATGAATRLLEVSDAPAFAWSPDGTHLGVAQRLDEASAFYQELDVISASDGTRKQVASGNIAAFFWSPDGTRLAYALFRGPDTPGVTWWVVDTNGEQRIELGSYVPDDESFFVLMFFDQYAQSMSPWSPDGKYLAYSGFLPGEANDSGHVFVVPTDGSAPARPVADGQMAAWPAPRHR